MIFIIIVISIIVAELIIKKKAEENLEDGEVVEFDRLPIKVRKLHNYGMANSTLNTKPQIVKMIGVAVMAVLVVGFVLILPLKGKNALKVAFALILGGGLSNLLDRFMKGYVTDYFSFKTPFRRLNRLVFNISDIFIFVGAVIAVLSECFRGVE